MATTIVSQAIESRALEVRVHAIRTGSVRVRANQARGKGSGAARLLHTMTGRQWTEWLPVYAWLIEHPEGNILVDTGETARVAEPGYFPGWHPYYRRGVEFEVEPGDEIGQQLENRWIDPVSVRRVVMTHLHTDHAGGLHHFPHSEILVDRNAYKQASGLAGRLRGFLPNRWPEWLAPTLLDMDDTPIGPFPRSLSLTNTGDIVLVPTPGHTPDHLSVVVRSGTSTFFIAGDASYTQQLMVDGQVDGIGMDEDVARDTLWRIRRFAEVEPLIYLPSHDPEAEDRLLRREIVFPR